MKDCERKENPTNSQQLPAGLSTFPHKRIGGDYSE